MNNDSIYRFILVFGLFVIIASIFSGRKPRKSGENGVKGPSFFNDIAPGIDSFLKNPVGMLIGGLFIFCVFVVFVLIFGVGKQ